MATKRIAFSLCGLLVIGHVGLYIALVDFNRSHQMQNAQVAALQVKWEGMRQQILQSQSQRESNQEKLSKYDQLEYKLKLFRQRYPEFARIIDVVCEKGPSYGFHPDLIMGIIEIESGFNPMAVSFRGAFGLMQIHFWVWKDELKIEKNRIFDIDYNIDLGLQILAQYAHETGGNIRRALMQYNNGYRFNNEIYPEKVSQTAYCLNRNLDKLVTYTR